MPTDVYLQLDGIQGESTDANSKGAIEIDSFSWGASGIAAAKPAFSTHRAYADKSGEPTTLSCLR